MHCNMSSSYSKASLSIASAVAGVALVSPALPTPTIPSMIMTPAVGTCSMMPGTDCAVPDISSIDAVSAESCCSLCGHVSGCAAFTYKDGVCHFKQHCNFGTKLDNASTSGFLYPSTCSRLPGTECVGEDIGSGSDPSYGVPVASEQDCGGICGEYFGCSAFTYKDDRCYLKSACSEQVYNRTSTSGLCDPTPTPMLPDKCSVTAGSEGWPRFESLADLSSSEWASYFKAVYGEIPSIGYPICTSDFWFLHKDAWEAAGISGHTVKTKDDRQEEHNVGDLLWSNLTGPRRYEQGLWILKQLGSGRRFAGNNQWIEVRHLGSDWGEEFVGMWFMYAPGSGVWFNTGRTAVFDSHTVAAQMLCGTKHGADDAVVQCARDQGQLDSYQFNSGMSTENFFELVGVHLAGQYPCGTADNGTSGGFRAGWQHQSECHCDNGYADGWLNCQGTPTTTTAATTTAPSPGPTPPSPSGCPGGSLVACIQTCPSSNPVVFEVCVGECQERCSGPSCTGGDDGDDLKDCLGGCPSDKYADCVGCCASKFPSFVL